MHDFACASGQEGIIGAEQDVSGEFLGFSVQRGVCSNVVSLNSVFRRKYLGYGDWPPWIVAKTGGKILVYVKNRVKSRSIRLVFQS